MNLVAAIGWALVGLALFIQKFGEVSAGTLISIALLYAVLIGVPALTARALKATAGQTLRKSMIFANGMLIVLWVLSTTVAVYLGVGVPAALLGVLAFVVPEAINIRALRMLRAKLLLTTASPQAATSINNQNIRKPVMKILIVDRETSKVVYSAEVHLQGQNYEPSNEERFALAWNAALEDKAVAPTDRDKYAFVIPGRPAGEA